MKAHHVYVYFCCEWKRHYIKNNIIAHIIIIELYFNTSKYFSHQPHQIMWYVATQGYINVLGTGDIYVVITDRDMPW